MTRKLEHAAVAELEWPVGEGADQLDLATKSFRLQVLRKLLSNARPLRVADEFKEFMDSPGVRKLTHSSHLLALLPSLAKLETDKLVKEYSTGFLSSVFDAAGHHGDVMASILRKVESFVITQRLAGFRHSDKVFDHETLNQIIIDLATDFNIMKARNRLKAFCHDAASMNLLSAEQAKALFYDLFDMVCASHILQRDGEHFVAPLVDDLIAAWFRLFKNGTNKIALWRKITGLSFPSYNPIKWHSRFGLAKFIMENFTSVVRFIEDERVYKLVKDVKKRSKTVDKLAALVVQNELKVQLAAYVDFSAELVNSTYAIEGDGPTALIASFYINSAYLKVESYSVDAEPWNSAPNLRAVLREIGQDAVPDLLTKLRAIVVPALNYFNVQEEKHPKFFEFLQIASSFCPWFATGLTPNALNVLFSFKVISYDELQACLKEVPSYHLLASESPLSVDPTSSLDFLQRKGFKNNLPEWKVWRWWYQALDPRIKTLRSVAERLGLYQATSAAAERVFSLFRHHINENSTASAEYLKWQAILNYNSTVDVMADIDLDKIVV